MTSISSTSATAAAARSRSVRVRTWLTKVSCFGDLKFDWLTSDVGLTVLIVASIVEIVADKVPAIDHFLDSIGTFIRPAAATVATASVLTGVDVDPTVAAIVGFIVGTPTALGFHTLKAGTRVASTATTMGCANPVLSLIEDVISLAFSILSIFAPILVPLALLLFALALWQIVKRARRVNAQVSSRA